MYRVRYNHESQSYRTTAALRAALRLYHRHQSVAIEYETRRGMKQSLFVDVLGDGQLIRSYGDQQPVTFEEIHALCVD